MTNTTQAANDLFVKICEVERMASNAKAGAERTFAKSLEDPRHAPDLVEWLNLHAQLEGDAAEMRRQWEALNGIVKTATSELLSAARRRASTYEPRWPSGSGGAA